jgi:hypothetical protein
MAQHLPHIVRTHLSLYKRMLSQPSIHDPLDKVQESHYIYEAMRAMLSEVTVNEPNPVIAAEYAESCQK